MKRREIISLCSAFIVGFCLPQGLRAQETITWLEATFPPFLIHEGAYAGQGYGDVITDILTDAMDGYDHVRLKANISRHYKMFKDGEKVCTVGLYKNPERREFLYFSIPSFFTLPNVVVINKEKFEDFGGSNMVSLRNILEDGSYVIGRSKNRSYGPVIDSLFDAHGTPENVFEYEGPELSAHFFEMLKRNRLDGIIGLPEEVLYQAENLGIRDQIMTLAITENQDALAAWLSYVACSKTAWGKRVIEDINAVLLRERPKKDYRAAYERWLDDASIPGYRDAYEKYFLSVEE